MSLKEKINNVDEMTKPLEETSNSMKLRLNKVIEPRIEPNGNIGIKNQSIK